MRTLRRIAGLVVAAVVVGAGGGSSTGPAATVDGETITHQQVVDELRAIRSNTAYLQAVEGSGVSVLGGAEDTFDTAFVATQLAVRIQYLIVSNEIERRGLEADAECRAAAEGSLADRFAGASAAGDGAVVLDAFADGYRDYLVDRETDFLLLQGDLIDEPCVADDAVGAYYEENRDALEQACASHILVATEEEAVEIVALLGAGGDFAALAAERSVDPGSAAQGGSIGCVTRGSTVPEFEQALFSQPIGEVGGPVQTEFGFHVLRVDRREVPPLDEVRGEIEQRLSNEARQAFGTWFVDALSAADVTVDPRYGEWNPATGDIERPAIEATTTSAPIVPQG